MTDSDPQITGAEILTPEALAEEPVQVGERHGMFGAKPGADTPAVRFVL